MLFALCCCWCARQRHIHRAPLLLALPSRSGGFSNVVRNGFSTGGYVTRRRRSDFHTAIVCSVRRRVRRTLWSFLVVLRDVFPVFYLLFSIVPRFAVIPLHSSPLPTCSRYLHLSSSTPRAHPLHLRYSARSANMQFFPLIFPQFSAISEFISMIIFIVIDFGLKSNQRFNANLHHKLWQIIIFPLLRCFYFRFISQFHFIYFFFIFLYIHNCQLLIISCRSNNYNATLSIFLVG